MTTNQGIAGLKEEVKNGVLVLKVSGRLDAITTPSIERKIFEHIHHGHNKILIDFSELDYLSSAGMRMLLSITKKLKNVGKIILCSVNDNVLDVLKMSGFDRVLDIENTEENALRKY
ncbi:MAG: STAS domain-containing protein [Parachlamydiales bacterium]|jgi:anti-sigma B factor antagonist/stage II sporulation protein AA (anti-sigma F factor antagonist)